MCPGSSSDEQWTLVERMCAHDPAARIKTSTVVDELARLAVGQVPNDIEGKAPSIETVTAIIAEVKQTAKTLQGTMDSRNVQVVDRIHDLLWDWLAHLSERIKDVSQGELEKLLPLIEADRSSTMELREYQDTLAQFTEAAVRGYALHRRIDKLIDVNLWRLNGADALVHNWQRGVIEFAKPRAEAPLNSCEDAFRRQKRLRSLPIDGDGYRIGLVQTGMFTSVLPDDPAAPRKESNGSNSLPPLTRRLPPFRESSDATDGPSKPPPLTRVLSRRMSKRPSMRRVSTQRTLGVPAKPEIPDKLLKFLQRTSEQQDELDAVKTILVDDPSARNEHSVDLVYAWMMRNCQQYSNNIFGSAPEYIRREICRQMKLITIKSQDVIIRQGDTGDRCYIAIDGIVDVYIRKETALDASRPVGRRTSSALIDSPEGGGNGASRLPGVNEYGDMVANLGPGAMFGEVVLLNPSARRNATILASQYTTRCDLICLERADYTRLVRTASMEASHYNNAVILDHIFLFRNWEKHDKMRLVSASRSLHFAANDYLYRAGAEAKWMFIVTAGEVKERVSWSISAAATNSVPSSALASSSSSNSSSSSMSPATTAAAVRALFMRSSKKNPERVVNVEMLLVGPGDIVGELPVATSRRTAPFDIKAVTDVQVLAIDRRFLETVVLSASREQKPAVHATVRRLRKIARDREDWRQQRIECGIAYPNAPVTITWQLMRMSNSRCPRCGERGHLASDTSRCDLASQSSNRQPLPPTTVLTPGTPRVHRASTRALSPVKMPMRVLPSPKASHGTQTADGQQVKAGVGRTRSTAASVLRDLLDDSYLPSPRELLDRCRDDQQQQQKPPKPPVSSPQRGE